VKNVEVPLFSLFIRVVFMHGILQDFRNVLRQLPKDPVFASVAILTLGLAVGANTPIFSIIQTILLNSLPYRDVHRLVMIWSQLV
jgi:putative ABC transport system permease protein